MVLAIDPLYVVPEAAPEPLLLKVTEFVTELAVVAVVALPLKAPTKVVACKCPL